MLDRSDYYIASMNKKSCIHLSRHFVEPLMERERIVKLETLPKQVKRQPIHVIIGLLCVFLMMIKVKFLFFCKMLTKKM